MTVPARRHNIVKIVFWVFAVAILAVLAKQFGVQELLRNALLWIQGLGSEGAIAFIIIYILACVFFIPGFILTLGAGVLFGVVWGSVCVSIGSSLGAAAAFLAGRYFLRDWVSKKIEGNAKFKAIDEAVARGGWRIVVLARLSPVFPFNLLNYSFGLTRVSFKHYFFASWLGMLPGTILYVYLGSLAGNLAALGADAGHSRNAAEWVFYGIGLAATVLVTVYVTRIAQKALKGRLTP